MTLQTGVLGSRRLPVDIDLKYDFPGFRLAPSGQLAFQAPAPEPGFETAAELLKLQTLVLGSRPGPRDRG